MNIRNIHTNRKSKSAFVFSLFFSVFIGLISFVLISGLIFAATDSHTVKQEVDDGVTDPPEAPTNLTATAVSTSQIDLDWDASVPGDLAVDGYQIFRDSVAIATTTNVSYSDTGLTLGTSYSYQVRAFDTSVNYSGLSNEASATTLTEDVDDGAGGASGGGSIFKLTELSVEPDLYKAVIEIKTNFGSKLIFHWGQTPDYEAEVIATDDFKQTHTVTLSNLSPQTKYYFEFNVTDNVGRNIRVSNQTFKTSSLPTIDLPLNVSNFEAKADQEKITLSWQNPSTDFKNVRIVRSTKFFPRDQYDGELIYEGRGQSFVDKDVEKGVDYYYGAFVENQNGRFSSGAVTRARLFVPGEEPPPKDLFGGIIELPASEVHPLIRKLTLRDFKFIQDGKEATILNGTVFLKGDRTFKVLIDYGKLPEVLKTLAVTLKDPNDPNKIFNFLLRVNQDRTAYEASVAPLGREGLFGLGISVLDHKNRGLKNLTGSLRSSLPFSIKTGAFPVLPTLFFILFILILILMMRLLWSILNSIRKHEATT